MFRGWFYIISTSLTRGLAWASLMGLAVSCSDSLPPSTSALPSAPVSSSSSANLTTSTVTGAVSGYGGLILVSISAPSTVAAGSVANIVISASTGSGAPGVLSTISFGLTGGTSLGTFGSISATSPGKYTLPYTGDKPGTPNTLKLVINETPIEDPNTIAVVGGPPHQITILQGNSQNGLMSTALAVTPQILVTDVKGNAATNAAVHFQVTAGGGTISGGQSDTTLTTDAEGKISIPWVMGSSIGTNTIDITANAGTVTNSLTAYAYGKPGSVLITGTSTASEIDLAWTAPTYTGSGTLSYNIQRSISASGPFSTISTVTGTTFNDTTAALSTIYYYQVITNNTYTTSDPSNQVQGARLITSIFTLNTANSSSYNLSNSSAVDFTTISCELTTAGLNDTGSTAFGLGTANGIVYGTLSDGVQTGVKLGNAGSCDGTVVDCNPDDELTSTWTPNWASLIGYWKLNGTTGAIASGATIPATVGSVNGTVIGSALSYSNGHLHQGISGFNSSSYIDLGTPAALISPSTFTISGWVYPTSSAGQQMFIFAQGGFAYRLSMFAGGGLSEIASANGTSWSANCGSVGTVTTNAWSHIVETYDGANIRTYINGTLSGTCALTGTIGNPGAHVTIGAQDGASYFFTGTLDDIAMWSTALTGPQVQTVYAHQNTAHSGVYTSRVADALSSGQSWTDLIWNTTLPFLKALPDGGAMESVSDYSSLSTPTPAASPGASLSPVRLYHLDEAAGTTGANTVIDSSGSTIKGTPNGITFGNVGRLGTGAWFDGSTSYIDTNNTFGFSKDGEGSFSFWINPATLPASGTGIYQGLLGTGQAGGYAANKYSWTFFIFGGGLNFYYWMSAGVVSTSTTLSGVGKWDHIVLTYNAADPTARGRLYKNGVLVNTYTGTPANPFVPPTTPILIGNSHYGVGGSAYFNGMLDEIGLWNRALSPTEVQQMYQRGASRVKFQARSCTQSNCSDGVWKGPDGSSNTYFSELNNTSTQAATPSGSTQAAAADLTLQTYGTPVPPNRYFQYRMIMESDNSTAMPEVKSVTISPNHVNTGSPTITTLNFLSFNTFMQFTDDSASNCPSPSSVTYNLSPNGTTWYYWNGTAWASGGTSANSNTAIVLNTPVGSPAANPISQYLIGTPKNLYVRAYLNSDGTHPCSFSKFQTLGN